MCSTKEILLLTLLFSAVPPAFSLPTNLSPETRITLPNKEKIQHVVTDWIFDIFDQDAESIRYYQDIIGQEMQELANQVNTVAALDLQVTNLLNYCYDQYQEQISTPHTGTIPSLASDLLFDTQHRQTLVTSLIAHSIQND